MRRFLWGPMLINLALYAAALMGGLRYMSQALAFLLPAGLDYLRWLLWPVFAVAFFLFVYLTFAQVANLIGAPFYGRLAHKVLTQGGWRYPASEPSWTASLALEFQRFRYFVQRAVPLWGLSLIPGVGLAAPLLWLGFNAWFLALEYLAYPLDVQGVGFPEQRRLARRSQLGVLSFGGAVLLGLAVPGLNLLIAPAAVAGAALYVREGCLAEARSTGRATR